MRCRIRAAANSCCGPGSADGDVVVEIRDSGHGIPEKHLAKIFDPFFTTKPVGQGTGLGLSVSYGIIHENGGTIEVESPVHDLDQGTIPGTLFRIRLPLSGTGKQQQMEDRSGVPA